MKLLRLAYVIALALTMAATIDPSAYAADKRIDSLRSKAEAGDAEAQMALAESYTRGDGVPKDSAQTAVWCRKAADQGHPDGQNCMGSLYQFAEGVPQDYAEASKWYQKAADQGHAEANTNLGYLYDMGLGVAQDRKRAVELYRVGAEKGSLNGMLDLGISFWDGAGVERDLVEAYKWLDLARFYTQTSRNMQLKWRVRGQLDELAKQMTPQQIRVAKDRARDWDRAHRPK